jgi:hypothetical protein
VTHDDGGELFQLFLRERSRDVIAHVDVHQRVDAIQSRRVVL